MDKLKKLLFLPGPLAGLLGIGAGCALGWVFLNGYETAWFAYPIYVLSFYALTVVCIWLVPKFVAWTKLPMEQRRIRFPLEPKKDFDRSLYKAMVVNIAYGIFHVGMGHYLDSWWMRSNGAYYLVNAVIMWVLVGYERKISGIDDDYRRELPQRREPPRRRALRSRPRSRSRHPRSCSRGRASRPKP